MKNGTFQDLPSGCSFFGEGASKDVVNALLVPWRDVSQEVSLLLVLGGSKTAEVEGISAAGATANSRRYTALADAELLLYGPRGGRRWDLPPLLAGVSPALISYVAARWLGLNPWVVAAGLFQRPSFPYVCFEEPSLGPAACLSTGKAMSFSRVENLWRRAFFMGQKMRRPLLLAECVPGGTTTAQAVLTGLGLSVADLISSSLHSPPLALKQSLVEQGLQAANLGPAPDPMNLVAAIGDPFQPVAAGVLLGAREAGQPVLLGGGSQMLAVLALALASLTPSCRASFLEGIAIGTTAWLINEKDQLTKGTDLFVRLMDSVGRHFDVGLLGIATGLRFHESCYQSLRDYERGYVKEGVGAGALALLAQLRGVSLPQLVETCDFAMHDLQNPSAPRSFLLD